MRPLYPDPKTIFEVHANYCHGLYGFGGIMMPDPTPGEIALHLEGEKRIRELVESKQYKSGRVGQINERANFVEICMEPFTKEGWEMLRRITRIKLEGSK